MKYIRTKDHFLGFYKEMSISLGGYSKGKYYRDVIDRRLHRLGAGILQDKFIIKQANTIEELCDEFVAEGIPFRDFVIDLNEIKKEGLDIHSFSRACYVQYKNCAIYGAIYVKGKGLIYVAKMNNKGELELL